jgi:hypothetical protein
MSKRRKIERPDGMAAQAAAALAYEQATEERRSRVLSDEQMQAAATVRHRRDADVDKAAYQQGSVAMGRREVEKVTAEERYAVAMTFVPHLPVLDVVRLRPQAVEPVMRVPFRSLGLDADLISRMFSFALWHTSRFGSFDWKVDLTEEKIDAHMASVATTLSQRTVNTYRSQLTRVMRGDKPPRRSGRKTKAVAAYSAQDWERLWENANAAGQWADDASTLLALAGGAGLRPSEVNYVQGSWVHESDRGMFIRVPDSKGGFRDVPVIGRYVDVIRRAVRCRPHTYLVMPQYGVRRNMTSHLKARVKPLQSNFEQYDGVRARNAWLSRLLTTGVPMVVVAYVAGVGGGSSLLADLAADLPVPEPEQVFKFLAMPELTH